MPGQPEGDEGMPDIEVVRAGGFTAAGHVGRRHPQRADDAAMAIDLVPVEPARLAGRESLQPLARLHPERLVGFRRVDPRQPHHVAIAGGITHRDHVAFQRVQHRHLDRGRLRRESAGEQQPAGEGTPAVTQQQDHS